MGDCPDLIFAVISLTSRLAYPYPYPYPNPYPYPYPLTLSPLGWPT